MRDKIENNIDKCTTEDTVNTVGADELETALKNTNPYDLVSKEDRINNALERLKRSSKMGLSGGSDLSDFMSKDNVAEFNKTLLMRTFMKGKIALLTEEQVRSECADYFLLCVENGMCPTMTSLAVYLGLSINSIYTYISSPNCAFREALKDSVNICHAFIENGALNGKVSVSLYQFLANNYFGLKSSQEISVVQSGQKNIDNQKTLKIIKEQLEDEMNNVVIDIKE